MSILNKLSFYGPIKPFHKIKEKFKYNGYKGVDRIG